MYLTVYDLIHTGSAHNRYEKLRKVLPVSYTFISSKQCIPLWVVLHVSIICLWLEIIVHSLHN